MPQVNIGPMGQAVVWIALIAIPIGWMTFHENAVQRAAPAIGWGVTLILGLVLGLFLAGGVLEHGPANQVTLLGAFVVGFAIPIGVRMAWSSVGLYVVAGGCFLFALLLSSIGCEAAQKANDMDFFGICLCQLAKLASVIYSAFAGFVGI